MSQAAHLRSRAARCREIARDYHPSVARPLYIKAREFDQAAALLERRGIERRERKAFGLAQRT